MLTERVTVRCVRSHYTYNGITRLELLGGHCSAITATDGGKLEVWHLHSGVCLLSQSVSLTAVSALSTSGQTVVTADCEAAIKVFSLRRDTAGCWSLSCVFQSEELVTSLNHKPIRAIRMPGQQNLFR